MVFVKIQKNKAFFKRFQCQKRRRRQGKTDFQARRKMIRQDKNKFNCRKYRLIVRFTNSKCICQIAYASIIGDKVICQATSTELKKYGIPCGHTNYAAAYATGLLIARRCLKHFGLDATFKGKAEVNGEDYHVEEEETDQRPFKCILDVGLTRTTSGSRIWGALKGAVDGGLHIPHNNKNFPGFQRAEEKGADSSYDAEAHKDRIFGGHVKEYMEMLSEEDPTKYEAHFSKFIASDIDAEKIEDMYKNAHSKIRADPTFTPPKKQGLKWTRKGNNMTCSNNKNAHNRSIKLTLKQRRAKVAHKIEVAQQKALAKAEEEEDDA